MPFVPIDRPIKNTAKMDFKVIKDFDYPAAATRHFEAVGAFCYCRPGRSLYKEIPLNELDYLLCPQAIYGRNKVLIFIP